MSILDAYEPKGEPIITPEQVYDKELKITDVCVVCFSLKALEHVLAHYEHRIHLRIRLTANGATDIYYLLNEKVLFFMSPIGSAIAGGTLHQIAHITGVTTFVYFGSCGVLDPAYQEKVIIPTSFYREEGFSYHFAPPSDYIDVKNHEYVSAFMKQEGISLIVGKGWTTDAIFNETKAKFSKRKQEGVVAVDMEGAGLQAIANHLNVNLYIFFFSGDTLAESSWAIDNLGGEAERKYQVSSADLAIKLGKLLAN